MAATVKPWALVMPPLHEKLGAPLAVSVVDLPGQVGLMLGVMVSVGKPGYTVNVTAALETQFAELVPETE